MKLSIASRAPLDSAPDYSDFASDALAEQTGDHAPPSRVPESGDPRMLFAETIAYASEVRLRAAVRAESVRQRGRKWGSE